MTTELNKKKWIIGAILASAIVALWLGRPLLDGLRRSWKDGSQQSEPALPPLKQEELRPGTGGVVKVGTVVMIHYSAAVLKTTGNTLEKVPFDSTHQRQQPLEFKVGAGQVLPGLDMGVLGMRVGGQRQVTIPPHLGYGDKGAGGGLVPPKATLIYDIDLLAIQEEPPATDK